MLEILTKIATNPVVAGILIPAIRDALVKFFEKQALRIEVKSAVKAAKAAKTAEELRLASKKLSDLSTRS